MFQFLPVFTTVLAKILFAMAKTQPWLPAATNPPHRASDSMNWQVLYARDPGPVSFQCEHHIANTAYIGRQGPFTLTGDSTFLTLSLHTYSNERFTGKYIWAPIYRAHMRTRVKYNNLTVVCDRAHARRIAFWPLCTVRTRTENNNFGCTRYRACARGITPSIEVSQKNDVGILFMCAVLK